MLRILALLLFFCFNISQAQLINTPKVKQERKKIENRILKNALSQFSNASKNNFTSYLVDSASIIFYDTAGMVMEKTLASFEYDSSTKKVELLTQVESGGQISIEGKQILHLNSFLRVDSLEYFTYNINTSSFELDEKVFHYYNGQNLLDSAIYYYYDSSQVLMPTFKEGYTYNSNGDYNSQTYYNYNNGWIPNYKSEFTYTSFGKYEDVMSSFWFNGQWSQSGDQRHFYNSNENLDSILYGTIDSVGILMNVNSKEYASYSNNNISELEYFSAFPGSINPFYRTRYSYFTNIGLGNVTEFLPSPLLYSSDPDFAVNALHTDSFYNYNMNSAQYNIAYSLEYFYIQGSLSSIPLEVKQHSKPVYPNPASETLFINFETFSKEPYSLSIFDLNGGLIKEVYLTAPQVRVDISILKEGVYIYKLENVNTSSRGKFIKQ